MHSSRPCRDGLGALDLIPTMCGYFVVTSVVTRVVTDIRALSIESSPSSAAGRRRTMYGGGDGAGSSGAGGAAAAVAAAVAAAAVVAAAVKKCSYCKKHYLGSTSNITYMYILHSLLPILPILSTRRGVEWVISTVHGRTLKRATDFVITPMHSKYKSSAGLDLPAHHARSSSCTPYLGLEVRLGCDDSALEGLH